MRKIILLFVLMMGLGVAHAQDVVEVAPAQITEVEGFNPASKRVYAELSASSRPFSTKVNVAIDFGQSTSWLGAMSESMIVDESGKEIKFDSMIDAMNYLGQFGWKFAQAYVVPYGDEGDISGTVYWILYKDVDDYSQITEGFMTKRQQRGH